MFGPYTTKYSFWKSYLSPILKNQANLPQSMHYIYCQQDTHRSLGQFQVYSTSCLMKITDILT